MSTILTYNYTVVKYLHTPRQSSRIYGCVCACVYHRQNIVYILRVCVYGIRYLFRILRFYGSCKKQRSRAENTNYTDRRFYFFSSFFNTLCQQETCRTRLTRASAYTHTHANTRALRHSHDFLSAPTIIVLRIEPEQQVTLEIIYLSTTPVQLIYVHSRSVVCCGALGAYSYRQVHISSYISRSEFFFPPPPRPDHCGYFVDVSKSTRVPRRKIHFYIYYIRTISDRLVRRWKANIYTYL